MGRKKWCVSSVNKDEANELALRLDIDPFVALLLISRGITTEQQALAFLDNTPSLNDPFELKDMDKAVERINLALYNDEKIAIYGDYDADGVTATSLLYTYLGLLGADVVCYIPDRNLEGYGLNCAAVKQLSDNGVKLIVTVDNGVSAVKEAEYAYSLGMELVITDHHKPPEILPKAYAVVNPHRSDCKSQFKDLAGVGVAFKLACALSDGEYEDVLDCYADLVAIGTIGDVVPLVGENRTIVKIGLEKINHSDNAGLAALKNICLNNKSVGAVSTAFSLVPRINAMGRVSDAMIALKLLTCDDPDEAEKLACQINEANAGRQQLEQIIINDVERQIAENPSMLYDRVLVFDGEGWHGGVIGIAAARFVERYSKPCIVITREGESAKGSARSIEGFSIYDAIDSCRDMLTHFGGHTLAAGFSLACNDIERFRKGVNDYARRVEMPFMKLSIDCKLRPEFISADILPIIDTLEPFGAGNPQPVFGLFSMRLTAITPIGGGKHLKLSLSRGNTALTALQFSVTPDKFPYVVGDKLDLAVRLEKNEYMGQVSVSIYIKEIRLSGTDDEKYLKSLRLYEKVKRKDRLIRKEALFCLPDRKFAADVFRLIRDNSFKTLDYDVYCFRLGVDVSLACRVLVCLDAFEQLGLIHKSDNGYTVTDKKEKVDLESAPILTYLKDAANHQ